MPFSTVSPNESTTSATRHEAFSLAGFSPAPVWIESNQTIVFANAALLRLLGYENCNDLTGKSVDLIRSGAAVITVEGDAIPASFSARDFADAGQHFTFVTLQPAAPYPHLPQPAAGLASAAQILGAILDTAGYGGWIADAHGRMLYAGQSLLDLMGLPLQQFVGLGWAQALPPADGAQILSEWLTLLRSGDPGHTQLSLRGTDHRYHRLLVTHSPVRDSEGRVVLHAGLMIGMEALLEREQDLQLQNEILTRANKELEHFAFNASHDLQDPLRIVRLMTELLIAQTAASLEPDRLAELHTIKDAAVRMSSLVRDLLIYARLLHRTEPAAPTDLNAAFQTALLNCQAIIGESKASVTAEALPTVIAEANQITSVFQNLLANAIKYARPGVPPEISVTALRRGAEWRICVADNGQGIAYEQQNDIFLPFKRLHGPELPGSGLGLAVCSKIVEHHGGRMWVESELGVGSLFYFTLPVE